MWAAEREEGKKTFGVKWVRITGAGHPSHSKRFLDYMILWQCEYSNIVLDTVTPEILEFAPKFRI